MYGNLEPKGSPSQREQPELDFSQYKRLLPFITCQNRFLFFRSVMLLFQHLISISYKEEHLTNVKTKKF